MRTTGVGMKFEIGWEYGNLVFLVHSSRASLDDENAPILTLRDHLYMNSWGHEDMNVLEWCRPTHALPYKIATTSHTPVNFCFHALTGSLSARKPWKLSRYSSHEVASFFISRLHVSWQLMLWQCALKFIRSRLLKGWWEVCETFSFRVPQSILSIYRYFTTSLEELEMLLNWLACQNNAIYKVGW